MATCPACDHDLAPDVAVGDPCPACGATLPATVAVPGAPVRASREVARAPDAAATSVRPPDHDAMAVPSRPDDRDPLAGWDMPGLVGPMSTPPPPAWSIIAGTAGLTGLVGLVTGVGDGVAGALRRTLSWSLVGAGVAAAALRVWELEPEPASWVAGLVKAPPRRQNGDQAGP